MQHWRDLQFTKHLFSKQIVQKFTVYALLSTFSSASAQASVLPSQTGPHQLDIWSYQLPNLAGDSLQLDGRATAINIEPERPRYLIFSKEKDWEYLWEQISAGVYFGVTFVFAMTFLPESLTKWAESDDGSITHKWGKHVSSGPIWDEDELYLNYVMHPYFGGISYTAARHAGFDPFESTLFGFFTSSLIWEYGLEAFAEIPAWQDLFVTPVFGAAAGELMIRGEKHIVSQGGRLLGSETLGSVSLFFLNPFGHINYWIDNIFPEEDDHLTFESSFQLTQDSLQDTQSNRNWIEQPTTYVGLQIKISY